jgi:2-keto-4-pentenoate hydratase/2-oxohepta-3-ene-1,7-dioic acid hydratase in catechol pathway
MRFVRCKVGDKIKLGVYTRDDKGIILLDEKFSGGTEDMTTFITLADGNCLKEIAALLDNQTVNSVALQDAKILSPIQKPVHDILCVGVNYYDHLEECVGTMDIQPSAGTVYFSKRASEIIGPGKDIPGHFSLDSDIDYEVELAVIIGKTGRDILIEDVEDHIFGYSVFNDISARSLQKRHAQWFRGKSLDGYAAMGPSILHKSALPMPFELNLFCRVNKETRQSSNTRFLIQSIPAIVSELSKGCTLVPGDIIATGTPGGVGMSFNPPRYLKPGDIVECEVEKVGLLQNRIVL